MVRLEFCECELEGRFVTEFQFLNGTIRIGLAVAMLTKVDIFQFLNGTIRMNVKNKKPYPFEISIPQ